MKITWDFYHFNLTIGAFNGNFQVAQELLKALNQQNISIRLSFFFFDCAVHVHRKGHKIKFKFLSN